MELQIAKGFVKAPVESLDMRIVLVWQAEGIWDDRLTRSPNHHMLGYPGAVTIIL